jgi:[protein-PII] uridylyltransferase
MLRVFKSAALYSKLPSASVLEAFKAAVPATPGPLSSTEAALFRDVLGLTSMLGPLLRAMFDCRLLDYLIPDFTHTRSLLQFNQYHSYTVDEHTLQAIETLTSFQYAEGPVGTAYRATQDKVTLHLAMLLHDVGKGFAEHHSERGRRIADRICRRLYLEGDDREQVMFLVHKHLVMPDLALRRDITDQKLLLDLSREVGSPDTLRMLFVLTMADVSAVGPGVMTDWKADLLAELFDRTMLLVSGKHYSYLEEERLRVIKQHVAESIQPPQGMDQSTWRSWIDQRLAGFSAYYLTATPEDRIAADLEVIGHLQGGQIHVTGNFDAATETVDYRIILHEPDEAGIFHRLTGVLTANRLEIIAADINTTQGGVVVDSFRVVDRDFTGEVPEHRITVICNALKEVLSCERPSEPSFSRNRRQELKRRGPVADLPLRVVIDNDSSDSRTIIDVFAHDSQVLLYLIARTLHELRVSVDLAKIGTHFDQVVDVFYVTELDRSKIIGPERLQEVRRTLQSRLEEFLTRVPPSSG